MWDLNVLSYPVLENTCCPIGLKVEETRVISVRIRQLNEWETKSMWFGPSIILFGFQRNCDLLSLEDLVWDQLAMCGFCPVDVFALSYTAIWLITISPLHSHLQLTPYILIQPCNNPVMEIHRGQDCPHLELMRQAQRGEAICQLFSVFFKGLVSVSSVPEAPRGGALISPVECWPQLGWNF